MITGAVVVFIPHAFSIPISRSLYSESFSSIFKEVFRFIGIDIPMSRHVLPGLFDFISLSLWIGISQSLCFLGFAVSLIHMCSIYHALGSCRVCIICPLEICCSFVVSLYVLCLGKFRTSRQGGQLFLEITCKFCTFGQCHLSEPCFSSSWSLITH